MIEKLITGTLVVVAPLQFKHGRKISHTRPIPQASRLHMLVVAMCGLLSDADGLVAIGIWARETLNWLHRCLQLEHGIRCHGTFGDVRGGDPREGVHRCLQRRPLGLGQRSGSAMLDDGLALLHRDGHPLRRVVCRPLPVGCPLPAHGRTPTSWPKSPHSRFRERFER